MTAQAQTLNRRNQGGPVAFQKEHANILLETNMAKKDVQQGTLALMVLKTLDVLGTLHGYGIARRIEQISGDLLRSQSGHPVSRVA